MQTCMVITVFKTIPTMNLKKLSKTLLIKPIIDNVYDHDGNLIKLKTTIGNVKLMDNFIQGTVKQDYLDEWENRAGKKHTSIKIKFIDFVFYGNKLDLLIHSSYNSASKLAILFSKIIFEKINDPILTRMINPDKLSQFIDKHNCTLLSCSWSDMTLPNLRKTNITGFTIDHSSDFKRYDKHGVRNNITFTIPIKEITLSISRNTTISIRTKMTKNEQEKFIVNNLLSLCN